MINEYVLVEDRMLLLNLLQSGLVALQRMLNHHLALFKFFWKVFLFFLIIGIVPGPPFAEYGRDLV